MKFFPAIAVAILVASTTQACAQTPTKADATAGGYVWYDGGKVRAVQLDDALIAEFDAQSEPAGTPVLRSNGVRVWRRNDDAATRAVATGKTSPVFRDSEGGAIRALPGNVIVRLDPAWDEVRIREWLAGNGLTALRRLPIGGNVLVVASPPGLAALDLANRLQLSGKVVSAQPEWWEQRSPR
jgi:hypothetical protein